MRLFPAEQKVRTAEAALGRFQHSPALEAGDIGTVLHINKGGEGYEVEFLTLTGQTVALVTLLAGQVRPLNHRELVRARGLAPI